MDEFKRLAQKRNMLESKLLASDYKAIKFAEGLITEADYAPIKAQRQAWRNEINTIEAQIKALRG